LGKSDKKPNLIVILGPTASGKTRLGVRLAYRLQGEIISADSRQVYRGLNIGAGKDLQEYRIGDKQIPYHLIDIVDLSQEFSVFHFQKFFYQIFQDCQKRKVWPILVGGTGLYLESVLQRYAMMAVPENPVLRQELSSLSWNELVNRLKSVKKTLHNSTDFKSRDRVIRAIEIAEYGQQHVPPSCPDIYPMIIGVRWQRSILRQRIAERLQERMENGLIEEVEQLHAQGISWERLQELGLEYRYITNFLQGAIKTRSDLFQKLNTAICQFAKRQETWFRRMVRGGMDIYWIDQAEEAKAWQIIQQVHG